jgi:hypothetical protein
MPAIARLPPLALAVTRLAARTSVARWLDEGADPQGSEGLRWVRVALTLSRALPL